MCQSVCDKKCFLKGIKKESSLEAPGNLQDVLDEDRDSERPERRTDLRSWHVKVGDRNRRKRLAGGRSRSRPHAAGDEATAQLGQIIRVASRRVGALAGPGVGIGVTPKALLHGPPEKRPPNRHNLASRHTSPSNVTETVAAGKCSQPGDTMLRVSGETSPLQQLAQETGGSNKKGGTTRWPECRRPA